MFAPSRIALSRMTLSRMTLSRRGFVASMAGALAGAQAFGQTTYPARTIKLVVPFSPGGSSDFTGRLIAQKMSEALGQTIYVENKPGANGIIGCDSVAKATPDGYTLLIVPREISVNPSISKAHPYDTLKDFAWIGLATQGPFVIVTNPNVPAKTFQELVALAKAQPGKLSYGSIGTGSISHLNVEALKQKLGLDILHVPYKGAGPSINGALSGEISMTITAIPGALGLVQEGKLRALAVGAPQRMPQMPDVPTLAELGVTGDVFVPTFFGLGAPANTPRPIIDKLNAALTRAADDPEVKSKLSTFGMISVASTPEAMATTIARDVETFAGLVRSIGLKPE